MSNGSVRVTVNQPTVRVASPGPQGAAGPSGLALEINATAGAALSGHRIVFIDSADEAQYASSDTDSAYVALGLTTGAASAGSSIQVQLMGRTIEQSWDWIPEKEVYLGLDGFLTQTPPVSGVCLEMGVAVTPYSIYIRIQQAVELNNG